MMALPRQAPAPQAPPAALQRHARVSAGNNRGAPRRLEVLLCEIPTAMPPLRDSRIRRGAGLPGAIHSRSIGLLWNLVAARGLGDLAGPRELGESRADRPAAESRGGRDLASRHRAAVL